MLVDPGNNLQSNVISGPVQNLPSDAYSYFPLVENGRLHGPIAGLEKKQ